MSLEVNLLISQAVHLSVSCSHCGTSYCHADPLQFSSEHGDAHLSTCNYVTRLCNTNQLDAIFILSFFRQSTSTCFGNIRGPSSWGILNIYNSWYVLCFSVDCLLASSQLQSTTHTNCCVYIYNIPPDDGPQICPKHVEVDWQNKVSINIASSWFLLHTCIEMHGQQNKIYVRHVC